jgi:hypothetical protein
VVAVDIVAEAVASAKRIAAQLPPGALTVMQGDFYTLNPNDKLFRWLWHWH